MKINGAVLLVFLRKNGGEIELSEWKMEANIVNDTGTAVHTSITRGIYSDHSYCRKAAKTELNGKVRWLRTLRELKTYSANTTVLYFY